MDLPFDNFDIVKHFTYLFKDDPHYLLKLAHTSSYFRKEILENEVYPDMINIIKHNNIYQEKQIEKEIIKTKINKERLMVILQNYKSILREIEKGNSEDIDVIQFNKNEIKKYNTNINKLKEKVNHLNLKLESLRKKNLFFNKKFVEIIFLPQPRQRLVGNFYYGGAAYYYLSNYETTINVDNIKLKYIVKNDNGEYKYIENLFFNKKSNMLHLTNCGSLKNSDLNNCVFIKKDDLDKHTHREFIYCKKCTRDIRNFLI